MPSIGHESLDWREDPAALSQLIRAAYIELMQGGDVCSISQKFPSNLEALQHAARDFSSTKPYDCYINTDSRLLKSSWATLITVLFHEYFHRMQHDESLEGSDPLSSALLIFCEVGRQPRKPGFDRMVAYIKQCIRDGLPSSSTSSDAVVEFLIELYRQWMVEKRIQLELSTESLMPWSKASLQEGSLRGPVPARDQGCIHAQLVLWAYNTAPLCPLPDMPWLGAAHDGYPRSSSLTSYVAARWSPSFTSFDNAALWQAAMTFGVLEAITDLNIPSSLLLETRPGGDLVFSSKNLNVLLYHWTFSLHMDRAPFRRIHSSFTTIIRARKSLSQTGSYRDFGILRGLSARSRDEVDNILCPISLFIQQLYCAVFTPHQAVLGRRNAREQNPSVCQYPIFQAYKVKMIKAGWCPFVLGGFSHIAETFLWMYMSSMRPFIRHSPDEHKNCTEDSCLIHNIDESTYQTRHTQPGCSCLFLVPSISDVTSLLSEGHYPVISYDGTGLTTHREDVGPYVAISHVWADGLGSNTAKGLPTCQIERIDKHVRELLPGITPAFWIDGLCIPKNPDNEEEPKWRKMAIRKMGETYRRASRVLVFDESIRTLCSQDHPLEENVVRIATSPWMQRVWTLQEALLARDLRFEFSTGVVSASSLRYAIECEGGLYLGFKTIKSLLPFLAVFGLLGSRKATYDFEDVAELLYRRMTSRPSDQPLAVAGLLDVDTKKLDVDGEDLESRIRALLLELKTIPGQLLWKHFPRMEQSPCFQWAPASLTSIGRLDKCSQEDPDMNYGTATCSPQGITIARPVSILYLPNICYTPDIYSPLLGIILVRVSSSGAVYSLTVPRHRPFNAIVFSRPFMLGTMPEGARFPAAMVNIPDCQDLGGLGEASAEREDAETPREDGSVIVCEFVQCVDLECFQSPRSSTVTESRLIMSRIAVQ